MPTCGTWLSSMSSLSMLRQLRAPYTAAAGHSSRSVGCRVQACLQCLRVMWIVRHAGRHSSGCMMARDDLSGSAAWSLELLAFLACIELK